MDDHPVPTLLYHYTDIQGFKGIVDSQELWATHILYLNDAQEFDYAVDFARRLILEQAEASADLREHALLTRLGTNLSWGRGRFDGRVDVCVASFSKVDDGLSQWRGYCPNGAGYSIGFVAQDLSRVAFRQGFILARCLYDEAPQREAITQVLEEVRQSPRWTQALDQLGNDDAYRGASKVWSDRFAPLAPTIKHGAFREEQEWRLISKLVSPDDSRWRVRAGRSMPIPYIPITLAPVGAYLPIQDVVVGPTPHMELAMRAVGVLLEPKLEPVMLQVPMTRQPAGIRNSRIPYRNW